LLWLYGPEKFPGLSRNRPQPRETWKRTIVVEMKTTAGKIWRELEKAAKDRE